MKLLSLDTSTHTCTVALSTPEANHVRETQAPRQHVKKVLVFVDALLSTAGLSLQDLDGIALGVGPGSFTGLRIGASLAQGLAYGAQLPIIPISSLQIMAQTAYETTGAKRVMVAQDARMQELYWGEYALNAETGVMMSVQPDQLTQAALCKPLASSVDLWVGSALALDTLATGTDKVDKNLTLSAKVMRKITVENAQEKRMIDPCRLQLNYLRDKIVQNA